MVHRVWVTTDLSTARGYLKSDLRLIVWCKVRLRQKAVPFPEIVDAWKGYTPLIRLKRKCSNCGSRRTDAVLSGSHLRPSGV
jgi:hypothetical protein